MLRRTRSIRQKVMLVVLLTTVSALLVAAGAMLAYETRAYRTAAIEDLRTQADIVARASAAAVAFDDPVAAQENLALLRVRPQILGAVIETSAGKRFAQYRAAELPPSRVLRYEAGTLVDGVRIDGDVILVVHPIMVSDRPAGRVMILARYELASRIRDYLGILAAVLVASLAVALLLSATLQRAITQPIIAVTDVAHSVMERRDFSLRVPKRSNDEVGYLVEAFNAMLAEVGRRADALEKTNRSLSREMDERRVAENALRAADRRKDEFLATLAHELRNPLAPLRNALAILKLAGSDPRVTAEAREMMDRQLTQMVRLVDDLLDVSRITTGKLALRREPVDLDSVVKSAVDTVTPYLEGRQHTLRVALPRDAVHLYADPTRLAQVFSNLLHNAAKFTPPGGRIEITGEVDGNAVVVRVADNGIGIAPEMLAGVFEMFAQADQSLERVHAGLGVGLTLARRLVELHGGTLAAISEGTGRGSQFVVRLPLAKTPALGAPRLTTPTLNTAAAGHRVLLVDDNRDFANSLAVILRALGNEVRVVHDGEAALALVDRWRPEIGFLDIGLPRLNGYDLARALRARAATAHMMLVAITGWGQENDRQRAFAAGFDHHLVKPAEPARVIELLAAFHRSH
jgi:signal transduction histidine kinase/ActR/RegA family two-component response regulator